MLKAKALCAVKGNATPEADTHGNGLHDLIGGMQNIAIESVGSDEKIPEAVGQLAIRMMKNNEIIKDLLSVRQTVCCIQRICFMSSRHCRPCMYWMRQDASELDFNSVDLSTLR